MQNKNIDFKIEKVPCSVNPIRYDEKLCVGCNRCVNACQCDVLFPSNKRGEHPIVMFPGECYYCGACVIECQNKGAITLEHPLMNKAKFINI